MARLCAIPTDCPTGRPTARPCAPRAPARQPTARFTDLSTFLGASMCARGRLPGPRCSMASSAARAGTGAASAAPGEGSMALSKAATNSPEAGATAATRPVAATRAPATHSRPHDDTQLRRFTIQYPKRAAGRQTLRPRNSVQPRARTRISPRTRVFSQGGRREGQHKTDNHRAHTHTKRQEGEDGEITTPHNSDETQQVLQVVFGLGEPALPSCFGPQGFPPHWRPAQTLPPPA